MYLNCVCKHLRIPVITRLKSLKDKFMLACLEVLFKKYKWFGLLDVC